jgi:hypothetical protein
MDQDKHFPFSENHESNDDESGSDELLADDNLRLPESANILVRLHALRAWLSRKLDEATIEVGTAALALQELMQEDIVETRPRRRARLGEDTQRFNHEQQVLSTSQQRLSAYEEAQAILEDCMAHTSGERVLVEYYLTLEELVLQNQERTDQDGKSSAWLEAMADVLSRIERVGTTEEE